MAHTMFLMNSSQRSASEPAATICTIRTPAGFRKRNANSLRRRRMYQAIANNATSANPRNSIVTGTPAVTALDMNMAVKRKINNNPPSTIGDRTLRCSKSGESRERGILVSCSRDISPHKSARRTTNSSGSNMIVRLLPGIDSQYVAMGSIACTAFQGSPLDMSRGFHVILWVGVPPSRVPSNRRGTTRRRWGRSRRASGGR